MSLLCGEDKSKSKFKIYILSGRFVNNIRLNNSESTTAQQEDSNYDKNVLVII